MLGGMFVSAITQSYECKINEKETELLLPNAYMSGLFYGSQLNWAILNKEAYDLYMLSRS